MRKVYFTIAIVSTLIGVILAFENIIMIIPVIIFFSQKSMALFYPMALMFIVGLIAGACFVLAAQGGKSDEDDDDYAYMDEI